LRLGLGRAFGDCFIEKFFHLTRRLPRQFALLTAEFTLLCAEFALLFSQGTHLFAQLRLLLSGVGLKLADLALQLSNFRLNPPNLLRGRSSAQLFQLGPKFVELGSHVRNLYLNLLHSGAEFLLLLSQRLLLLAKLLLFPSELLLRRPQLSRPIDRGLIANDVGLLVALKPDEVARDLLSKFLDMAGIF
jgi:hypothetical protein